MAKVNLQKMSREQLLDLQKQVERQLKASDRTAKKDALAAARKAAKAHGFALDEILGSGSGGGGTARKTKAKAASGPKSAPKYANPADKSQTWTGRGRQPNWIKDALAAGKKLDSMAI